MLHITQKIAMKLSKVQIGNGKKMFLVKIISDIDNTWEDLCHLWQYHVLVKIGLFACSNTESQTCKSDFHFSGDSNLSYMDLLRHVHLEQVFQDQLQKKQQFKWFPTGFVKHKPQANSLQQHKRLLNRMMISTQIFSIQYHVLFIWQVK